MPIKLKVPDLGESIREVRIGQWLKREGQWADQDEDLVEIESEKATVTLPAPKPGRLVRIAVHTGEDAKVGQIIGEFEANAKTLEQAAMSAGTSGEHQAMVDTSPVTNSHVESATEPPAPVAAHQPGQPATEDVAKGRSSDGSSDDRSHGILSHAGQGVADMPAGPDARRALREFGLTSDQVAHEKSAERLTRQDVVQFARKKSVAITAPRQNDAEAPLASAAASGREEEVVPMTLLRRRIAERLVEAQHQAALLTTINEIDMSAIIALRSKYGQTFQETHEARLGFMSFFVKATIEGLKEFPPLNAEVRGTNIAYRNYFDIGIAVSTDRGLVVPVLRSAERMSFAEIESQIAALAQRARQNELTPAELTGGTFTITNGGVYGSLLSMPIVNPPQSGILGLHAIQDRPAAVNAQVLIRPLMYVALTYDHRVVDGREAVSFLKRVKELIEDPARMLLEA